MNYASGNRASTKSAGSSFTLSTLRGDSYTFTSGNADDVSELVAYFLDGLKERSRYVVAIHSNPNRGSFINIKPISCVLPCRIYSLGKDGRMVCPPHNNVHCDKPDCKRKLTPHGIYQYHFIHGANPHAATRGKQK